jgi:hypothetical protein
MSDWYVREADGAVRGPMSTEAYSRWITANGDTHQAQRQVCDDDVDGRRVSTVFLALDHNHFADGPPLIFETMIFGGEYDQHQWRYSTVKQAREGHRQVVAALKSGRAPTVD